MAYQNQQFFGAIDATNILNENFIIATGNFASGSNEIADFSVISGDVNLLRISQSIYSVGGNIPTSAYITNINGSLITLSEGATGTGVGDTIGISTPSGSYLVSSASFNDPNNALSVTDITGSIAGQDYAILAATQRNGAIAKGVFHIYKIKEVVHRDIATANFSFFAEWGEQGTEADSGDVLRKTETALAIVNLSDTGSLAPEFSLGIAGMESLPAGSEYVGYNVALNQYFAALSGSSGTTATGSFTGSFTGSLLGDVIGDLTGTASYALYAISASHEIVLEESSSLAETASLAITLSPEATASYALTASHALNVPDTASHALTAVTASYAFYAVTASHETTYELSSSLAETASFAQSGRGEFDGTFSGSNYSTEFTFDGEVLNVLGNVFVQGTLDASTKNFKIQHPTMPGYYLVHSSLEGPERGMYVRGKLKTSDTIYLPDYWNELTDDVDITVQLTPIGNSCTHFVKSVNKQEIVIGCDCGAPHCFYIVHAQRYNEGKFDILQPKKIKKL